MLLAMALHSAASREHPAVLKFQQSAVRLRKHNGEVEVDEMAVVGGIALNAAHAVGVVTNAAWRVLSLDVLLVFAKALVVQNAGRTVAFEAEVVETLRVANPIQSIVPALQDGRIYRTVWTRRATATRPWAAVPGMAVRAEDAAGCRPGRQEARHLRVYADCGDRVKRRVRDVELQALVGLYVFPSDSWIRHRELAVTLVTDLVLEADLLDGLSVLSHSTDTAKRTTRKRRHGRCIGAAVGVVTIGTLDVCIHGQREVFGGGVDSARHLDGVTVRKADLRLDVGSGHVPVVADQAVVLLLGELQNPLIAARGMGPVAVLTGRLRHVGQAGVFPGIRRDTIPGGRRRRVR